MSSALVRPINLVWLTVPLCALTLFIAAVMDSSTAVSQSPADALLIVGIVAYPAVGSLIVTRQPDNRIGWLLCAFGFSITFMLFTNSYGHYAVVAHPGSLPLGMAVAWISGSAWLPTAAMVLWLFPLLFPDGRLLSPRWSVLLITGALALLFSFFGNAFAPGPINAGTINNPNPLAIHGHDGLLDALRALSGLLLYGTTLGALASVIVRYRRSDRIARQQIKLFVFAILLVPLPFVLHDLAPALANYGSDVTFPLLPIAIGIAVLRYRLYDIDIVISRALLFALMAAFIAAVYVAIVAGVGYLLGSGGRPNLFLSIVATAVVALAFQPVREQVEKLANRVVYGRQLTPYEVLSRFSDQVAVYGRADMLTEIAKVVADGVGAGSASVWVRSNGHLVPSAYWPAEGARPNQDELDRLVDVSHLGETLGAIGIVKRRGEPLTSVEEGLLQDLAAQAGPVIHNVTLNQQLSRRLAELSDHERELRRSRQNIVAAQDAERRRLERNIHDGAQQHLVALTVKLRLATNFATKDSERTARLLEELDTEAEEADETLAALSRGIYPPALTEHGLEAALRQEANTLELNCRVVTRDLHRHDLDVEGAVYFCCLEALQNAAKHARGAEVEVSLEESVGELQFSVRDRGPGFNEENVRAGSGLKNMRDRIESLGGYVQVFSRPGQGAWIVGRVPVPAEVAV